MACERCGGNGGGAIPGAICPECGKAGKGGSGSHSWDESWAPPSTVAGRFSVLSRAGKIFLVGGVVLTALAVAASVTALYGGDSSSNTSGDGGPGADPGFDPGDFGGAPQRIEPSARPPESASPSPGGSASGKPKQPAEESEGPAYSAWAGPGCAGGGRYEENGRFRDGFDGWYTVNIGGHKGDGCDGRFTAVPMSGSRTKDNDGTATWSWYVGSGYTTCSVAVVVPKGGRDEDVAGDPTVYQVLADPDDEDSLIKTFQVDQVGLRGRGAVIEKIPVRNQQLTVRLVDRGQDGADGTLDGGHHAAAQMRADCRA